MCGAGGTEVKRGWGGGWGRGQGACGVGCSAEGQGSTFEVRAPLALCPPDEAPPPPRPPPSPPHGPMRPEAGSRRRLSGGVVVCLGKGALATEVVQLARAWGLGVHDCSFPPRAANAPATADALRRGMAAAAAAAAASGEGDGKGLAVVVEYGWLAGVEDAALRRDLGARGLIVIGAFGQIHPQAPAAHPQARTRLAAGTGSSKALC